MGSKKIFVSRSLSQDSPIRKVASGGSIVDHSLIEFSAFPFEAPETDWVFFYSRNGVRFFFDQSNYELYPYMWACMSAGTADELSKYVMDISFVGEGAPQEVADAFNQIVAPTESVGYIRAENSIDSVRSIINSDQSVSIPVYSNVPSNNVPSDKFDVLVFTSPMNVNAWFSQREYKGERIITIGQTTAAAVTNHGISDMLIALEASEQGMADVLQSLIEK